MGPQLPKAPTLGRTHQNVCSLRVSPASPKVWVLLPKPTGLRGSSWPASRGHRGGRNWSSAPPAAPSAAGSAVGSAAHSGHRSGPQSASAEAWESCGCSGDGKQGLFPVFGPQSSHLCPVSTSPVTPCPLSRPSATPSACKSVYLALGGKAEPQMPCSFPRPTARRPDRHFLTSSSIPPLAARATHLEGTLQ